MNGAERRRARRQRATLVKAAELLRSLDCEASAADCDREVARLSLELAESSRIDPDYPV